MSRKVTGSGRSRRLNREAYATARAQGKSQLEALQAAGSRTKSPDSAGRIAGRLEAEPQVRDMIAAEKARIAAELEADWLPSLQALKEIIEDPRTKPADRIRAINTHAKLLGKFKVGPPTPQDLHDGDEPESFAGEYD